MEFAVSEVSVQVDCCAARHCYLQSLSMSCKVSMSYGFLYQDLYLG